MSNIRIYSDGLASPRANGAAAWAFVVYQNEKEIFSDKGLLADGQNSGLVAEYTALENALRYVDAHLPDEKVSLYVDSRLVLYQARGKWSAHADHLIPFRNRCQTLYRENKGVRLFYCKPEDNKADALTHEFYRNAGAGSRSKKPAMKARHV
ncbi:MAG TPA: reverse transcriptase-like protein [Pyrinomonadaceae bacterium]|jgi:ribonuclease HI